MPEYPAAQGEPGSHGNVVPLAWSVFTEETQMNDPEEPTPEELQEMIKAWCEDWDNLSEDDKQIVRTFLMLNEHYPGWGQKK